MKKIMLMAISFLLIWVSNASANDIGARFDTLKKRLAKINVELKTATGVRKRSLKRQKFLVRARLTRVAREICILRSKLSPLKGGKSGCGRRYVKITRSLKVRVICPANRKFGYSYNRRTRMLTIRVCNGLDGIDGIKGKNVDISEVKVVQLKTGQKPRAEYRDRKLILYLPKAKRGRRGRVGKISAVKIVQLAVGEKPRAEVRGRKIILYLPKPKDGVSGLAGRDGRDGQAGRDGHDGRAGKPGERILPDWLKIYAGGFYLLTHGLRHNIGGMVGMGFVLVEKRLDLLIEGGLGYETEHRMLSPYVKGGLGINFHPMVGMTLAAMGSWNLNYRNLSEFEFLGGTVGIYGLFFKHLRVSGDLLLGQYRWPEGNGVHKSFGIGAVFTAGYQF